MKPVDGLWTKLTITCLAELQPKSSSRRHQSLGSSVGDLGTVHHRTARSDRDWPSDSSHGSAFRISVALWHLDWETEEDLASWVPSEVLEMKGSNRPGRLQVWVRANGPSAGGGRLDWGTHKTGLGNVLDRSDRPSSGSGGRPLAFSWNRDWIKVMFVCRWTSLKLRAVKMKEMDKYRNKAKGLYKPARINGTHLEIKLNGCY